MQFVKAIPHYHYKLLTLVIKPLSSLLLCNASSITLRCSKAELPKELCLLTAVLKDIHTNDAGHADCSLKDAMLHHAFQLLKGMMALVCIKKSVSIQQPSHAHQCIHSICVCLIQSSRAAGKVIKSPLLLLTKGKRLNSVKIEYMHMVAHNMQRLRGNTSSQQCTAVYFFRLAGLQHQTTWPIFNAQSSMTMTL